MIGRAAHIFDHHNLSQLPGSANLTAPLAITWEIDSPDDQLGGSLCIRINRAGGRYIPGCLLCREGAIKNYNPEGCQGIFTEVMLLKFFKNAQKGIPIKYVGHGMVMNVLIKKMSFTNLPLSQSGDHKVQELLFDLDIQPDSSIPETQPFKRID